MIRITLALLVLASFSSMATAQEYVLTYTGQVTGTEDSILTGATEPTPAPYSATFSAFIDLSGPVNNLTLGTASGLGADVQAPFNFNGPNSFFSSVPNTMGADAAEIDIITQGGSIQGAKVTFTDFPNSFSISPTGAASELVVFNSNIFGGCETQLGGITNSVPGTVANPGAPIPCSVNAAATTGTWTLTTTAAPEIDPASAWSALTLLAGALALMRGRKVATRRLVA